ncbi:hypothetical protein VB636_00160, partial [Paracoccus sp. APAP_BH8]|uniref:hypothetical protein n=1 Tax=Paracoccus sp. APAP_BH8 TaxID=3110237 RepID=UPI002FD7BE10
ALRHTDRDTGLDIEAIRRISNYWERGQRVLVCGRFMFRLVAILYALALVLAPIRALALPSAEVCEWCWSAR